MMRACLNESPRPKAGKCLTQARCADVRLGLNESPRPKAGKSVEGVVASSAGAACLNESPRPKAGKFDATEGIMQILDASMKVPALRRGNWKTPFSRRLPPRPQ